MAKMYYNYIIFKDHNDGELSVTVYDDASYMFSDASRQICFSDCDDILTIEQIVCNGKEVHYGGWKPGMHYTFYDNDNNLVYENWFPQWDH